MEVERTTTAAVGGGRHARREEDTRRRMADLEVEATSPRYKWGEHDEVEGGARGGVRRYGGEVQGGAWGGGGGAPTGLRRGTSLADSIFFPSAGCVQPMVDSIFFPSVRCV
jgi:hypothetical protein